MKYFLCALLLLPALVLADQDEDFLAARDAFQAGDSDRVEQLAARLKSGLFEPYVTYYQLRLHLDMSDPAPIKEFLSRPDDTPVIDLLRSDWLKLQARKQNWSEFAAEYPRLMESDDEMICYAMQSRRADNEDQVLHDARDLWFSGKGQPESCTTLFDAALTAGVISEQDVWQRLHLALESNNIDLAKQLSARLPAERRLPSSALEQASRQPEHYLKKLKLNKATEGQRLVALFALMRLAKQMPQLAYRQWAGLGDAFEQGERQYFFGWLGYEAARTLDPRALTWFEAAGDIQLNDTQLAWRTRAALRAQNWHEVWTSIVAMSPRQQKEGAWRYWKARAWKVLGREADADALFTELSREYNFYGQLAAEELGASPASGMFTVSYQPSNAEVEAMMAQPAIQRTVALYQMGLRPEAAKEWSLVVRKLNDKQLLVASEIARRNEMYDRSIHAADRTLQLHDFTLRYPAPYRDALRGNIRDNQLEEAWVYGLMRQESRFVTQAKSNVGASGLMQIMPATAHWVARQLGMRDYRSKLISQLDVNLKLGTYYMKNVLATLDNNPVLASAAYNAGPARARQWQADKPLEGAIYVESIPFDETRDYVKKVMSNTVYYAKLFGESSLSLKQRLGTIDARKDR
ncbi:MAG TPA: transglycosylase SLT domain-containing protein [Gallionellaceae bacterium]